MDDFILYDDTEQTSTRFVGYAGNHARFDVAITTTNHFYGKKLVAVIQNGCTAILGESDVNDISYVMSAFRITDEQEAEEFAAFLSSNL